MPGHASHGCEYARILYAARLQLGSHHALTLNSKLLGSGLKAAKHGEILSMQIRADEQLFSPLPEPDIKAYNAILIAHSEYRDVAGDVVLGLDDLLGSLRDFRAVGQSEIV
jgi:hypothetical protein